MPVTPKLGLELFEPLGVGWREDATAGALLDYNMMLIDAASGGGGGGTSVSVNGATVDTPNFSASPTAPAGHANVVWQVSGSSVSAYVSTAYDASGAAAAAQAAAIASADSYTDGKISAEVTRANAAYDASGAAAAAQAAAIASADSYTDGKIASEVTRANAAYDALGAAATALASAEAFTLAQGYFISPMTVHGDVIYENASLGATRLPVGSTGQVLTVAGGQPSWATPTVYDALGAAAAETVRAEAAENNMVTAGSAVPPSPAFSVSETPSGVNSSFFTQDVSGNWHQQAGVDTSTVMSSNQGTDTNPTNPNGILTWDRMMYFRDSQNALQTGKNAFLSVNHLSGTGTSYNNQDRALWITMGNIFAAIDHFSIDGSNNVTFVLNTLTSYAAANAFGFKVNQRIQASGLSTGTYLNGIPLSITSVSAVAGGAQTIVCSDSGFTHGAVGSTSDTGTLNQLMYSMANIQMEQDILGTPVFVSGVDTEASTLSIQMADYHAGSVSAPNYGCNVIRAQYYREAGAGVWGSVHPACIRALMTDNNDGTHGQDTMTGIFVQGNAVSGNNDIFYGIHVLAPGQRFGGGNYGILIDSFGANASDYSLSITGGQINLGGTITAVGAWPSNNANYVLAGPASGGAAAATFRALVAADLPVFVGDSGTGGVQGAVPAPSSGEGASGYFLSAAGNWQIPSVPASSVAWNNITSATGNLSVSLGTDTTTFQQTSNAVWLWQNTSTGTVGSTNASPLLELAANYYTGAAGAQDTWSIGASLVAGANAISTLTVAHSGSTGAPQIALPAPASNGATNPQIIGASGATVGVSVGANAGLPFTVATSTGSVDMLRGYQGGAFQGSVSSQSSSASFGVYTQLSTGSAELGMALAPGATTTHPIASVGHGGTVWPTTGSGPYIGLNVGATIALGGGNSMHLNWAPLYGTGSFIGELIAPTINQVLVTNTVVGSALVANVGAIVFSTTNAYAANALIQVALGTNTALNGTQTLSTQQQRAGSPYTITNSVENSSSVVTLTIGTHNVVANDWVYISGLTTATWLNGQVVKISSVVANTSITFTDLSVHGTSATHADTGTVTDNHITFALTHANITGSTDTGTANQQSTGNYTALKIAVTETLLQAAGSYKLIDCFAGSAGTTEVFAVDNTGRVTEYAGTATVSQGLASETAAVDLTAQSAAIAATSLIASLPASGMYRISWSADITTASDISSVLGGTAGFQVLVTSPTDSVVKTFPRTVTSGVDTDATNTTATGISGVIIVYGKSGSALQYQFGYTDSHTSTAMQYELHVKVERM